MPRSLLVFCFFSISTFGGESGRSELAHRARGRHAH